MDGFKLPTEPSENHFEIQKQEFVQNCHCNFLGNVEVLMGGWVQELEKVIYVIYDRFVLMAFVGLLCDLNCLCGLLHLLAPWEGSKQLLHV